ncbi:hypothetical protein J4732_20900 [Serratia marcescens]|uniref:FeS cluster assembly protein sufD n=1 Tax=Serratia marcescens TaxID=615 RepID=A0A939NMT2_SERMA|nr:hypothetical protein [Serratia marcescens]
MRWRTGSALRLGWPTRKHENWKYTPLESLLEQQFLDPQPAPVSAEQLEALALGIDACRLVFIDGRQRRAQRWRSGRLPVRIDRLRHAAGAAGADPAEIFPHLTESPGAGNQPDSFAGRHPGPPAVPAAHQQRTRRHRGSEHRASSSPSGDRARRGGSD